ncbi:MAG TPA: hypothetical protein VMF66_05895 [Candidatus Acidoferrum sp.]|nr:hypothetical protein [Candidatus Acidoferrum sp.]
MTDERDLKTRTFFEKCLGNVFRVEAIEQVEGLAYPLIEFHVGHMLGYEKYNDSIWIEPRYIKLATGPSEQQLKREDSCPS